MSLLVAGWAIPLALSPGEGAKAAGTTNRTHPSATAKNPDFERGQQAFSNGDWQEAVDYFKKALADDAENAEAYNLMGYSYRRMGNADSAFKAYAQALSFDPDHRGAIEYLGATYLLVGDLENAEAQLVRLKYLCGKQCRETVKLQKSIARYVAGADKQALLRLDSEDW